MTETVGLVTGMAPRKKQLWRKSSPGESGFRRRRAIAPCASQLSNRFAYLNKEAAKSLFSRWTMFVLSCAACDANNGRRRPLASNPDTSWGNFTGL